MSKHLTVTSTVELLESLRQTVREFAAAEDKVNREFRTKSEAAEKRFADDLAAHDRDAAARLQSAEEEYQAARTALLGRHEQRNVRITAAQKSARKQLLERIDAEEGRRRYQSQKGLLDTHRWRTDSLAANDATLADAQAQVSASQGQFAELEHAAHKAFRGYRSFRARLAPGAVTPAFDAAQDEYQLLDSLAKLHARTTDELNRFRGLLLPRLFGTLPLWIWIAAALLCGAAPFIARLAGQSLPETTGLAAAAAVFILALAAFLIGKAKAAPLTNQIATNLESARHMSAAAIEKAQARHASEIQRIEAEAKQRTENFQEHWKQGTEHAETARHNRPREIDTKWQRAFQTSERLHATRLERLDSTHAARIATLKADDTAKRDSILSTHQSRLAKFRADFAAHWQKLEADWRAAITPLLASINEANRVAAEFAPWQSELWKNWTPPAAFGNAAKFATLEVDLKKFAEQIPTDPRLKLGLSPSGGSEYGVPASAGSALVVPPLGGFGSAAGSGGDKLSLPLILNYPQQGSLLFETTRTGHDAVFAALNNIIFRLLATTPAGKLSFTIIDPVALGQNFSSIMHLADYEDNVINGRIWTQPQQIEERLADLNEHMEKVIQMYLRNEYETIAEYNLQAGNIAEKYHFVVVADFPANFSESAVKRLLRIAASGARCGVYTLIHWDHRHATPPGFFPEELRKNSICISAAGEQYLLAHPLISGARVHLDAPPEPQTATELLHTIGEASRGSNRVEVPFAQVAPAEPQVWSLETSDELRVPIGRSGATKLQYLALGKGTRQHALIAGKTGSGKSTLFHVMITNLALWYSPGQVEFYLVDFKKGVEFKAYATRQLPHARVVAIESDREFGLSVLQRLDEELRRRGELFRKLNVQDLPGYNRARTSSQISVPSSQISDLTSQISAPLPPLPRTLLLIDEFQEFFVEDDRIAQAANLLLDRIVRQGRAFGIHVILGSQTLGGAYTLARTTMGQMVVRIALQCNEADAYLIMDENNPAPRLLSRPGEGIYNDAAGAVEANSPFQAVWLDDGERDQRLQQVRHRAGENYPAPIVFEGNAPADVRDNPQLHHLLTTASTAVPPAVARLWLGAPNSIKGPTEATFARRSGNNLLIVGQREEAVLAMLSVGLISLAAQYAPGQARFIVFESTAPGSPERAYLDRVVAAIPHDITFAKPGELPQILNKLSEDLNTRANGEAEGQGQDHVAAAAPATFLFLHGMQNFKKLRQEDDFSFSSTGEEGPSPAAQIQKLITEGPANGIHNIATLDTYNNVTRYLGRKTLTEFEMRVLFQMSANDSASLCDDPKASTLGLHRALFFNEQEGYLETFRPYALPDAAWIAEIATKLSPAR